MKRFRGILSCVLTIGLLLPTTQATPAQASSAKKASYVNDSATATSTIKNLVGKIEEPKPIETDPGKLQKQTVSDKLYKPNDAQTSTDSATALTSSTNLDPASRADEAPYKVSVSENQFSTLSGDLTTRVSEFTLPGRGGLSFELARVYDSQQAPLYGIKYRDMTITSSSGTAVSDSCPETISPTYQRTKFPLGTGWSFDMPQIEIEKVFHWDHDNTRSMLLHMPGGAVLQVGDSEFPIYPSNYPWMDLQFQSASTVSFSNLSAAGTETSRWVLKSLRDQKNYYFDSNGNLIEILDNNGNTVRFYYAPDAYYEGSLLRKIVDATGNAIDITYTSQQVTIQQGTKQVVYQKQMVTGDREALASVQDAAGRKTTYSYALHDAYYQDTCIDGSKPKQDPVLLLTSVMHPTGAETDYQYETPYVAPRSGLDWYRVSSIQNRLKKSDGTFETKNPLTITYKGTLAVGIPNLTTVADDLVTTTYIFDSSTYRVNQIIKSAANLSISTSQTYDTAHMPVPNHILTTWNGNSSDQSRAETSQFFDNYQNITSETDAFDNLTKYTYDSTTHLPLSMTKSLSSTQTQTTKWLRDSKGNVTKETITDQSGTLLKQTSYQYDSNGNVTVKSEQDTGRIVTTNYQYGYQNSLLTSASTQVTKPDGTQSTIITRYDYDPSTGLLTKSVDGNGNATTYEYDPLGRLNKKTNPDNSTYTLQYDDINNTIDARDESGLETLRKWNPLGRLMETDAVRNGSPVVQATYQYDNQGRKIQSTDANGNITSYAYDGWNRLTKTTYADTKKTTIAYDDANHTKTTTDGVGVATVEFYDKIGRLLKKTVNNQPVQINTYDTLGNLLTTKDGNGNLTTNTYDALGQLTSVTDPQNAKTSYSYDLQGHLTQITFADGKTLTKKYDEAGRLIQQTDELGQVTQNQYDNNNNLILTIDRKGQTLTYSYDSRNRLTRKQGGGDTVTYSYDAVGRRTDMNDATGHTGYSYSDKGELLNEQMPDGKSISYTYDANSNRTSMTDPFGRVIRYTVDNRNRLQSVALDANAPEATYVYAADSMLQQLSERNGTSITYAYNPLKEITTLKAAKSDGSVLSNLTYTYDAQGNQIRKNENGADFRFLYDSLNRIANNSQYNETYAYDARGNRQTLLSDQPVLPSGGTYTYDVWNRLTQVITDLGSTVTYRYNGDGLLYERAENGVTTRYYYDNDQMIAEATVSAGVQTLKARYVRGAGNQLVAREDANNTKVYYLHNGHGDVTELRDGSGNVLNAYSYDIWGNSLNVTEQEDNPFRYAGEYWDSTTSLQYLRARWYDPLQGRFLTEDSEQGDVKQPLSLNLYTYAASNPLIYIDPSGHNIAGPDMGGGGGVSPDGGSSGSGGIVLVAVNAGKLFQGKATSVYVALKEGVIRYVGITYDVAKRAAQHDADERGFQVVTEITETQVTRNQARAIEQALIENLPDLENAINSISPKREWYKEAVEWGENWLKEHGWL